MKTKWANFIGVISALCCLLWMFSLGWAYYHHLDRTVAPLAQTPSAVDQSQNSDHAKDQRQNFTIVALGDSLTRGTGDVTGKGYVGYMMDQLKARSNQQMTLYNLGIRGQTSVELIQQVQQKQVQRQLRSADLIVITIGANDLFRGGQTLMEEDFKKVKQIQAQYLTTLDGILSSIRASNSKGTIYFVGLYNPFNQQADAEMTSKIVRDWNYNTAELSAKYPKTVFVPTDDLFLLNVEEYLYSDKFHPNTEGYRLIGERIASLVRS